MTPRCPISRRVPNRSFISSWPAARAIWICSITSRLWRDQGKPYLPEIIGGRTATPSFAPTPRHLARGSSSRSGASRALSWRKCCHLGEIVDDVCFVWSDWPHIYQFNHAPENLFEHRLLAARPPKHGLVGHLWPGCRNEQPAGVRGDVHRRRHQRRRGELVEWLSADSFIPACGFAIRAIRSSDATSPPCLDPRLARDTLDLVGADEPSTARRLGRSRNRHSHRSL